MKNYGAISFDGSTVNGNPVFEGTHVPVQALFEYLEDGKSLARFLDGYPAVNKKAAVEVLQMAEQILKENFSTP